MLPGDGPHRREPKLVQINSLKQMFPLAHQDRRDGQLHFIDLSRDQISFSDCSSPS